MSHQPSVLIVGAGIAGLSLAAALRHSSQIRCIERRATFAHEGTGIYLPPNAVRAFAALGLDSDLLRIGQQIGRLRAQSADGSITGPADLARVWPGLGPSVGVHRADLHQLLVAAAGVEVTLDVTLAQLRPGPSAVDVVLSDGSSASFDLVVGADGVHSSVRRLLWPDVQAEYGGESWWRAVVSCPPELTDWTLLFCRRGNFLMVPIGAGRLYVAASAHTTELFDDPVQGRASRVRKRFADISDPFGRAAVDQLVTDEAIQSSPAEQVWVDQPATDRVVLIGDASHATTPSMAQGAAMATEDAVVLSDELGRARPDALQQALAGFAGRRLPRTRYVQDTTAMRNRLAALPLEARLPGVARFEELSVASFTALVPAP